MAKANLLRIPGDKDFLAERIIKRVEGAVDQGLLNSLTENDRRALGRYGIRMASIALRKTSPAQLEKALLAVGISSSEQGDPRDMMVGISLHYMVAQMIGMQPGQLFSKVADRLPISAAANTIRQFGAREDVTLEAFGWKQVDTAEGPDFYPS